MLFPLKLVAPILLLRKEAIVIYTDHLDGETTAVGFEGKDWSEESDERSKEVEVASKDGKLVDMEVEEASKVGKLVGSRVNPCFSSLLSSSSLSMLVSPEAAALEV